MIRDGKPSFPQTDRVRDVVRYRLFAIWYREKFSADPVSYLDKSKARPEPAMPEGTIYTCPMHPEVRSNKPGKCPKCGMFLERVKTHPRANMLYDPSHYVLQCLDYLENIL